MRRVTEIGIVFLQFRGFSKLHEFGEMVGDNITFINSHRSCNNRLSRYQTTNIIYILFYKSALWLFVITSAQ